MSDPGVRRQQGMIIAVAQTIALGVVVLFATVTVASLRGSPGAKPGPSSVAPSPSVAATSVVLELAGNRVTVTEAADCARLAASDYYTQFCVALAQPRWQSIQPPGGEVTGPSPQMLARVVRAAVTNDYSACTDPLIIRFAQLGARSQIDASTASQWCVATIDQFALDGGTTIPDLTSVDNANPLKVSLP